MVSQSSFQIIPNSLIMSLSYLVQSIIIFPASSFVKANAIRCAGHLVLSAFVSFWHTYQHYTPHNFQPAQLQGR